MSEVEERLARSLTAETAEIIPYLPHLLQDLWDLGSQPEDIEELISTHAPVSEKTKTLDLACGKGAVSVRLAREFSCHIKGIDLMPEFITYAKDKAREVSVDALCEFEVGDINQSVQRERDYDIVILGAVGDVLGNPVETVSKLKSTVKPDGYILIDDGYGVDECDERYSSRGQWVRAFHEAGVKLVAEIVADDKELAGINTFNQECIIRRASELKAMHPEKTDMFEGYIRSQQAEIDEMNHDVISVTWLLQAT